MMEGAWLVFLLGLPFCHFLPYFHRLPIWTAQTLWAEGGVVLLLSLAIWRGVKLPAVPPLSAWFLWTGLTTLWLCANTMLAVNGGFPIERLLGFNHALTIFGFCLAALATWTKPLIRRLLHLLAWVGVIVLGYTILQYLNLDEFYQGLGSYAYQHNNLVGVIGNPAHLAAHLAILSPLFLLRTGWGWRLANLLALLVIFHLRAFGAALGVGLAIVWCLYFWSKRLCLVTILVGLVGVYLVTHQLDALGFVPARGWMDWGWRWSAWNGFWTLYTTAGHPITGLGLGAIWLYVQTLPDTSLIFQWHHVHLELFQTLIEQGAVGLGLVIWLVIDWVRRVAQLPKTREVVTGWYK